MATSITSRVPDRPRQMLSMRGESLGKNLSDVSDEAARELGRLVARAFQLAGMSQQEAAHTLAYANQSPISKLITGAGESVLAKLLTIPRFKSAWVEACAESTPGCLVQTVVTVGRKGGAA